MTSKTRASLSTEQSTNFGDNTTGAITPAILRSTVQDMIDSTGTLLDSNAWSGTAYSFIGSVAFSGNVTISGSSLSVSAISNFTASTTFSAPILIDSSVASFGVAGSTAGQIFIAGSTSGTLTLATSAAAGGTQTFQNATDTFVYLATADTLTNKTINGGSAGSNTLQISGVTLNRGQYPATATNDSATSGNIGEYVESVVNSASQQSLTTGSPKSITSIALNPGDWDVAGNIAFVTTSTTNVESYEASLSMTNNTMDNTNGRSFNLFFSASGMVPTAANPAYNAIIQPCRFVLSVSTSVFIVANSSFTVSSLAAYGIIRARRAR